MAGMPIVSAEELDGVFKQTEEDEPQGLKAAHIAAISARLKS
jgi:hypothetical protein